MMMNNPRVSDIERWSVNYLKMFRLEFKFILKRLESHNLGQKFGLFIDEVKNLDRYLQNCGGIKNIEKNFWVVFVLKRETRNIIWIKSYSMIPRHTKARRKSGARSQEIESFIT